MSSLLRATPNRTEDHQRSAPASPPALDSGRIAGAALLLLPTGLMAYFAFNSGGFYPGPPAYVAMALSVVLALRVLMAENGLEGLSWPLAVGGGALALYTLWTLISESWSHAPGRALVEFDLPLVYLLALVLFGSLPHTRGRLEWILRALGIGIIGVCACGLVTRVLPHLWPTSPEIANNRLSFPVTYWNVLGLLAVLGIVLCVHFASDLRERPAGRIVAAAAIPLLATTVFFTFSRGAIATAVVVLFVYALVGRPRGLISAVIAAGAPTAIALKFAYDANLLATPDPTTNAALAQGHRVAIAVAVSVIAAAILRALLLPLDGRLERLRLRDDVRHRTTRIAWISLATAAVIALIALSGTISHQYHRFLNPGSPGNATDLRARLTDPGNNGRIDTWRVAWHQFVAAPIGGKGAGTFQNTYLQKRTTPAYVTDAHSLYMEVLDELGIVGLVLLIGAMLTVLVSAVARARGPNRPLYAALFAVLLAWAIHAGVDWDWEMPVVSIVFFSLGGFALAKTPRRRGGRRVLAPYGRVVLALGCLLLAVAPAYVWLSQRKLDDARAAFAARDCRAATGSAESSISILGNRAEPYEILSYCDMRRGMPDLAVAAITKALSLDPHNWNYEYGLALMRAGAGLDPRAAARKAVSMNPLEPLTQQAWQAFRSDTPQEWEADGKAIANQFTSL